MRIEEVAHLLGRRPGQAPRLGLDFPQLLHRGRDGGGEAGALGLDVARLDMVLRYGDVEMVADMRRTDGNAGRDGEPVDDALLAEALVVRRGRVSGLAHLAGVTAHRSRRRRGRRAPRWRAR